jgi:sulfur relay (sulfurtransferase) DsrF/TusC family protein
MKLAVILTKAPYGDIQAAEAVRHAMGATGEEIEVKLLLVDDGVYLAKKGQDEATSGYTNLGETLKDIIDLGGEVFVEKGSLKDSGLETGDIIEGLNIVNGYELSQILLDVDKTMIF